MEHIRYWLTGYSAEQILRTAGLIITILGIVVGIYMRYVRVVVVAVLSVLGGGIGYFTAESIGVSLLVPVIIGAIVGLIVGIIISRLF